MENEAQTQLESQVVDCFQLMLSKYQQLSELIDPMVVKQDQGQSIHLEMDALQSLRDELALLHQRAAILQKEYKASREHSSSTVNQLTDQTTRLIKSLVGKVNTLEQYAKESHRRLIPAIDENVRILQMKQAYRPSN